MTSRIIQALRRIAVLPRAGAHVVLDSILDAFEPAQLAAANFDWSLWARPEQYISTQGPWLTRGACAGRGSGKTTSNVCHVLEEIDAGRARRVALVGQSEQSTIDILVTGATGILALCPPWLGAVWEPSSNVVRFANGAICTVYSAESPRTLRGPQFDLGLATEIAAWPAATAEEAMTNLMFSLRLGYARLLWDSTPKARSPLMRMMHELHARDPELHVLVTGRTDDNALHLAPGVVKELRRQHDGTRKGREELDGEFIGADEDGLFRQAWIDASRRPLPLTFTRRIIAIDPATTARARSDSTGIIELGQGADGQLHVLRDMSGKIRPETWPALVVDAYIAGACDLVVVETNMGGSTWRALLSPAAKERGLVLVELGPTEVPRRRDGIFNFRPIHSRGTKADRAQGAAAHVERGRVSFGPGLARLEESLSDFDGRANRPDDRVDAFTSGVYEIAGADLGTAGADPRVAFKGIMGVSARLQTSPTGRQTPLEIALGGSGVSTAVGRRLGGGSGWRI
ncbi:terminase family protein [soil metagenome]